MILVLVPTPSKHNSFALKSKKEIEDQGFSDVSIICDENGIGLNIGVLVNQFLRRRSMSPSDTIVLHSYSNTTTLELKGRKLPFFSKFKTGYYFAFEYKQYLKLPFGFSENLIGWETKHAVAYFIEQFIAAGIPVHNTSQKDSSSIYNRIQIHTNRIDSQQPENYKYVLYPYDTVRQQVDIDVSMSGMQVAKNIVVSKTQTKNSILNDHFKISFKNEIDFTYKLLFFPYQFLSAVHTSFNFDNKIPQDKLLIPLVTYFDYQGPDIFSLYENGALSDIHNIVTIAPFNKNDLEHIDSTDEYIFHEDSIMVQQENSLNVMLRHNYTNKYLFDFDDEESIRMARKINNANVLGQINDYINPDNYTKTCKNLSEIDLFRVDPSIQIYQLKDRQIEAKDKVSIDITLQGNLYGEFLFIKYYSGIIIALTTLKHGGTLMSGFFADHPIYMELMCILSNYFDSIRIFKTPCTINYAQNHNIICEGFRGIPKGTLDKLVEIWKELYKIEKDNIILPTKDVPMYKRKRYYESVFKIPPKVYDAVKNICQKFQDEIGLNREYKYKRMDDFIEKFKTFDEQKKEKYIRFIREGQIKLALDFCKELKLPIAPYFKERYLPKMVPIYPDKSKSDTGSKVAAK